MNHGTYIDPRHPINWLWWCTLAIPVLKRQRQEGQVTLHYRESYTAKSIWAAQIRLEGLGKKKLVCVWGRELVNLRSCGEGKEEYDKTHYTKLPNREKSRGLESWLSD